MVASFKGISARSWLKLASWTVFGTLGCLAVSIAYNWVTFRSLGEDALRQGIISATVLPIALAGPLFFFLSVKLRELAIVNHRLSDLASLDGLTGCLNRRAFSMRVESNLEVASRAACMEEGALLVVDADRFKAINDRFGHDRGDEALKLIAGAIRTVLRKEHAFGRLGGEEFGIHLPCSSPEAAVAVAERVRAAVAAVSFAPDGKRHPLSVSVGCVCYREPAGFRELFAIADRRLYAAKRSGRNRVVVDESPSLAPDLTEMAAASG